MTILRKGLQLVSGTCKGRIRINKHLLKISHFPMIGQTQEFT